MDNAAVIEADFEAGGKKLILGVPLCGEVFLKITGEIASDLNWHGTQKRYSIHDPTPQQLASNYALSGGLQRCIRNARRPSATTVR